MPDKAPIFKLIPLKSILPSRHQARTSFDEEGIDGLAQSIKKNGLDSPFKVREVPVPNPLPEGITLHEGKCYEQVFGGRRLIAAKKAGLELVWAILVEFDSEEEAAMSGYTENTQREELGPLDEAAFFKHLKDLNPTLTGEMLAERLGRSGGYISQSLKMLELPEPVKDSFRRLKLTRSHILELMRLPNPELQEKAANMVTTQEMNLKDTRLLVTKMLENPATSLPAEESGAVKQDKPAHKPKRDGVYIAKSGACCRTRQKPLET